MSTRKPAPTAPHSQGSARPAAGSIPTWLGLGLALAAGTIIPLQGRVNGALGFTMEDPIGAAGISFGVGLTVLIAATALLPRGRAGWRAMRRAVGRREFPRWYLGAGVLGAYLVVGQTTSVPLIGIALFTLAIVTGQTFSGLLVDRIGFGPGGRRPVSGWRLAASVLMVGSVLWAVSPRMEATQVAIWLLPVLLPLSAGLFIGFQQAMNGVQAATYGTPITATLMHFAAGGAALCAAWAVKAAVVGPSHPLPTEWWYYTGGLFGVVYIAVGAVLVRTLGVLLSGLCMIAGQLLGSLALDLLVPTPGTIVETATVLGTLLTLVAVVTAALPGMRGRTGRA